MFDRLGDVGREAAYGVRLLTKNPMHTLIVGITLALGIGATTAIFSVLYATMLAPLPYANSERLVWIDQRNAEGRMRGLSKSRVDDWKRNTRTLDGAAFGLLGRQLYGLRSKWRRTNLARAGGLSDARCSRHQADSRPMV